MERCAGTMSRENVVTRRTTVSRKLLKAQKVHTSTSYLRNCSGHSVVRQCKGPTCRALAIVSGLVGGTRNMQLTRCGSLATCNVECCQPLTPVQGKCVNNMRRPAEVLMQSGHWGACPQTLCKCIICIIQPLANCMCGLCVQVKHLCLPPYA